MSVALIQRYFTVHFLSSPVLALEFVKSLNKTEESDKVAEEEKKEEEKAAEKAAEPEATEQAAAADEPMATD